MTIASNRALAIPALAVPVLAILESLGVSGLGNEELVQEVQDVFTNIPQLLLRLLPVLLGQLLILLAALGLLLDGGDDPPGAPPGSHHALVRHRQQVPLLVGGLQPQ